MNQASDFRQDMKQVWGHRKFAEALALTQSYATFSAPGTMILVVGTSGAGKTTLRRQLEARLAGPSDSWASGTIPVVSTSIYNELQGLFSSKNFVLRLLGEVMQPFYSTHQQMPRSMQEGEKNDTLALENIRLSYSEPHLRLVLESAIECRKTRYILVDEAQHLLKAGSTKKAINNLDCIKGLAERTGAIVILFGTFEILPIWNRSAQLNRRLQDVVLHRYYREEVADLVDFEQVLESFSQLVPLSSGLSLRDLNEFLYDVTLGIIGEVARLLVGAYSRMNASAAPAITKSMLREAAHSQAKLQTLQRETYGGEAMLAGAISSPPSSPSAPQVQGKVGRRGRRKAIRDPLGQQRSVVLQEPEET